MCIQCTGRGNRGQGENTDACIHQQLDEGRTPLLKSCTYRLLATVEREESLITELPAAPELYRCMSYIAAAVPFSKKCKKEDVFLGKVLEYTLLQYGI